MIAECLETWRDLNALVRVHRHFHILLNRRLYQLAISWMRVHVRTLAPPSALAVAVVSPCQARTQVIPRHDGCLTPLGWAILHGPPGTLKWFLHYGISPDARFLHWWGDMHGPPLLVCAVFHERPKLVRLLLRHGARVNDSDDRGWTPMRYCRELCGSRRGVDRSTILIPTLVATDTPTHRMLKRLRAW